MDVINNPVNRPILSREEYLSKLFELQAKVILSGNNKSKSSEIVEQFNNLSKLREESVFNKENNTNISNNSTGFDIKI